ncbi:MAG TPA: polysaccharide deacetylase family protein [Polyangia bacterium]|nr:polysaccharide deacetylase family protein [Polyangia bacterium]
MTSSLGIASVVHAIVAHLALDAPAGRTPITRIGTNAPAVAITFDACATRTQSNGFDRAIFDFLRTQDVPATIFVSGRWVETHPDAMAEMIAAGFEFGDHSYDHPHMRTLTVAQIGEEIDQTEAVLSRYGKRSVAFRPPFGEWSPRVLEVVRDRKLPAVLWDVVSGDPAASMKSGEIIRTVLRNTKAGSIVIFHINGRAHGTAEALPVIVRELRARGFRFVPLSSLLAVQTPASKGPLAPVTPPPLAAPPLLLPAPPPVAPVAVGPDDPLPLSDVQTSLAR